MATVYYYGLWGTRSSATVTLSSITFNSLITTISTAEGLSSSYYAASLSTNPAINSVTSGTTVFSTLGIADGSTIVCTPIQSGTKEARQIQKLTIAQAKRTNTGNTGTNYYRTYHTFDRDLLAAKYVGNTATNISNTLTNHRPWI